ncbi:multiple sugar transport system permease protein [Microbacterium terrae]|uniref:L-arabinose transport system permease protein AraQ n=1 Tax=Microbacterium terrae TaxID=69369 RepID=A0A0M2GXJ0_9MICO|nr:carbohydrate ABC transporter permease [Microbacterium terrae]KJL38684.1 L-arabinose transport system permease protein AraQ [Microbacterium terrae]MBP1076103.1 multiple sugar transport system permease protein [Microbacterium terrae]GLJ96923.1 sugar ABC transporter permease [Microbacterium terrae]
MTLTGSTRTIAAVAPAAARRRTGSRSLERSNVSDADLSRRSTRIVFRVLLAVAIGLLVVISAGPLLWLAKSAVSTTQDILTQPFALWPSGIQWHNLTDAWNQIQIGRFTANSLILTTGEVVVAVFASVTLGYVLAVLRPKYGPVLNAAIMATLFIPGVISLIPLYLTVIDLGLLDSYWAVWLPNGVSAFNVLIMKQYFETIPRELFEAARVDGAGPVRILWSIVLPMARPIIGVVALLAFVASWKDFLWPLLALPTPGKQPLSVGLSTVAPQADLAVLMAGMFIAVIIPITVFIAFQKQFLSGAGSAGAVKG